MNKKITKLNLTLTTISIIYTVMAFTFFIDGINGVFLYGVPCLFIAIGLNFYISFASKNYDINRKFLTRNHFLGIPFYCYITVLFWVAHIFLGYKSLILTTNSMSVGMVFVEQSVANVIYLLFIIPIGDDINAVQIEEKEKAQEANNSEEKNEQE